MAAAFRRTPQVAFQFISRRYCDGIKTVVASDYESCDLTIDGEPWSAVEWRITLGCFSAIREFQRAESQL